MSGRDLQLAGPVAAESSMRCAEQGDAEYRERQSQPAHGGRQRDVRGIEEREEGVEQREHERRDHHPIVDPVACQMTPADALDAARLSLVVQAGGIADDPGGAERDPVWQFPV